MKSALRIITGIVVMLSIGFFAGFMPGGKAMAAGGKPLVPQPIHQQSQRKEPMSLLAAHQSSDLKTAKNTTFIEYSTTWSTKTISTNIWIDYGVIVSLNPGANVVINGDLIVTGELDVTCGTLTVNGIIDDCSYIYVSGTGKIIVNKVPSTGTTGTSKGSVFFIDAIGPYSYSDATLEVEGSGSVTINKSSAASGLLNMGGYLIMQSAAAIITANGEVDMIGDDSRGDITAGSLIVNGNFYQDGYYSPYSFCPGANFNVKIIGSASTATEVIFDSPGYSYFLNYTFSGVVFKNTSFISILLDMSSDQSIVLNVGDAGVTFSGSLNGGSLNVTANYVCPGDCVSLSLGGGTMTVNGQLEIDSFNELDMTNSNDKIIVNGNFVADSTEAKLTEGTLVVNGNFSQEEDKVHGAYGTYYPGPDFLTKIVGNDRLVYFSALDVNAITKYDFSETTIDQYSYMALDTTLQSNLTLPCYTYFSGDLNHHTLIVQADMVIARTATIDGGTLQTSGSLTVDGNMVMNNHDDLVIVGWNYYANSGLNYPGNLTDGRLIIKGSFIQSQFGAAFIASGSHTTVFCGSNTQTINFNGKSSAKFAYLAILNNTQAPDKSCYDHLTITGTQLDSIDTGGVGTISNSGGNNYSLYLPVGTDGATIKPKPLSSYGSNVSLSFSTDGGQTYQDDLTSLTVSAVPKGGSKTITIKVNALNDVFNDASHALASDTYNITVETIDADLGSLNLPAGANSSYDPATQTYNVQLPETDASFTWIPTTDNPDSSLTILDGSNNNLGAGTTVALGPGETKNYTIDTTAQDGSTKNIYSITFIRRNPVAGISVSTGTLSPVFSAGAAHYSLSVPATVPSVTVSIARGTDCSGLSITSDCGTTQSGDGIVLTPVTGGSATATISATDSDGVTTAVYTVTVTRVKMISGITVSPGSLNPSFDPATRAYTVEMAYNVTQVKVTPVKAAGVKYILINNKKATSFTAKPKVGETVPVKIVAVATNGTQDNVSYIVNVHRAPLVAGISLDTGTLYPIFSPTTLSYIVNLPADTHSVTVSPVQAPTGVKSVTNSNPTLSPVVGGTAKTTITATGVDGKTKITYTVTAVRAPIVTGILVTGGALSPAFNPTVGTYSVNVPATVSSVTLTPQKGTDCTSLKIDSVTQDSIVAPLSIGETKQVKIEASTTIGTPSTYYVNVTRAALVTNIASGTKAYPVTPVFTPTTGQYYINLPAGVSSVTVKVTKAKTGVKSLTINGKSQTSFTAKPVIGGTVPVTVVATAADNTTKATYVISVTRSSPLLNLTAGAISLQPAFSPATTAYSVELPAATDSVTLTPAPNTGCTCTNDANGPAGTGPANVSIAPGETKTVHFTASSSDKSNSVVYTVTVHRAGMLTGIDVGSGSQTYPLSPTFDADKTDYTVNVPADVDSVDVTPTAADGCIYSIDKDDTPVTLQPALGGSATATIKVCLEGGTTPDQTYTVTVNRAAPLTGITASDGTNDLALSPAFQGGTLAYTIGVDANVDAVTVTPAAADGCDTDQPTYTLKPDIGGSDTATIVASLASDPSQTVTYTVTVNRDPALSGITAGDDSGSLALTPADFNPNTLSYSVTSTIVGGTASEVTINAAAFGSKVAVAMIKDGDTDYTPETTIGVDKPSDSSQTFVCIRCSFSNGLSPVIYQVTIKWD